MDCTVVYWAKVTLSAHLGISEVLTVTIIILFVVFPDLLATFPPSSVKMKQPFSIQPWDASVEMVKKLFKVI